MKAVLALLPLLSLGCLAAGPARAQPAELAILAVAPGSVEAAVTRHGERIDRLFASLDLNRADMAGVRQALDAGDRFAAAYALLAVYRSAPGPAWIVSDLRVHGPDSDLSPAAVTAATQAALADTFTFQGVTGTAPRLPGGGLDWDHRGPRNDREWALFLNRHFNLLPLLLAAIEQDNAAAAARASDLLVDWVLSNPVADLPVERDISPAWQPMSSASRLLQVWPHVFFGLINHPAFTDEARLLMLASIPEQAAHLQKHHRKRHNHTIKEMSGLAHAAAVWPQFKDAGVWRDYALTTLEGELARQFYPDGVHQELSAHYHRSALQYYVWVKDFLTAAGQPIPASFAAAIERSADYMAMTLSPSGFGLLNNNGDLDANRERLADLARRFNRPDWAYIASGGATGTPPERTSAFYPWAGHAIIRDGFGPQASFAFFDVGPWGAAHQHNDKLNFTLAAHGRDLLVDGGRYRYEAADPIVAYLRGSSGHNVMLIDGRGQGPDVRIVEAPLVGAYQAAAGVTFVHGSYAAGFPGIEGSAIHQRALVQIAAGPLLVIDRIVTDRPRTVSALFRHGPDLTVVASGQGSVSTDAGAGNLRITPLADARPTLSLIRGRDGAEPMGWTSPGYNDRRPATVARFDYQITGTTILLHVLNTARDTPSAPRVSVLARNDDAIDFELRQRGQPRMRLSIGMADWVEATPAAQRADQQPFVLRRTGHPTVRFHPTPADLSP